MQKLTLPKKYISWSQLNQWLTDKDAYRERYYLNVDMRKTPELFFGSEIAKGLEDGSIVIPNLTQYPVQEYKIMIDVNDVPFYGYVDQYWPEKHKFRETKTGKFKPDGRPRWDDEAVKNHGQLDVYSTLIQIKDGFVDDETHLDWVITRNKIKYIEFDGHQLAAASSEIEMTGEVRSFRRIVTQTERERTKILIATVAAEISEDYARFLKYTPIIVPGT
jgi:hypothetical protein